MANNGNKDSKVFFISGCAPRGGFTEADDEGLDPFTWHVKAATKERALELIAHAIEEYRRFDDSRQIKDIAKVTVTWAQVTQGWRSAAIPLVFKAGCFCAYPHTVAPFVRDGETGELQLRDGVVVTTIDTQGADEYVVFTSCLDG